MSHKDDDLPDWLHELRGTGKKRKKVPQRDQQGKQKIQIWIEDILSSEKTSAGDQFIIYYIVALFIFGHWGIYCFFTYSITEQS